MKQVIKSRIAYEAFDGKQFDNEELCQRYEAFLLSQKSKEKYRQHLETIKLKSEEYPYSVGVIEDNTFSWYKITSDKDIEAIINVYDDISVPSYGIICVESEKEDGSGYNYCTSFEYMNEEIKRFYKSLGYSCEITEMKSHEENVCVPEHDEPRDGVCNNV